MTGAAAGGGEYVGGYYFPTTVEEATAEQHALRARVVLEPPPGFAPRLVAGLDVSMERDGDTAYAGIVVLELPSLETVAEATARPLDAAEQAIVEERLAGTAVGTPADVRVHLAALAARTGADELMLAVQSPTPADRVRTLEAVAEVPATV